MDKTFTKLRLAVLDAQKRIDEEIKSITKQIILNCSEDYDQIERLDTLKNHLLSIIDYIDDELGSKHVIFSDFEAISCIMAENSFSVTEILDVLSSLAKKNYQRTLGINDLYLVNLKELIEHLNYDDALIDEYVALIESGKYTKYLNGEELPLEKDKKIFEDIKRHHNVLFENHENFASANNNFYESYVVNPTDLTPEIIVDIMLNLRKLRVEENVIKRIALYLISVFESNLSKSQEIFDLELNRIYFMAIYQGQVDFRERLKRSCDILDKHNAEVINPPKVVGNKPASSNTLKQPKVYLSEKDVRNLRKYVYQFYDSNKKSIKKVPNYQELMDCLDKMILLDESKESISAYLSKMLPIIMADRDYLASQEQFIDLLSYLIKFKVKKEAIDQFIIAYKERMLGLNPVDRARELLDEIGFYDVTLRDDILYLLSLLSDGCENKGEVIDLLELTLHEFDEYLSNTEYQYQLAKKKG